jgi:hypothetical protein
MNPDRGFEILPRRRSGHHRDARETPESNNPACPTQPGDADPRRGDPDNVRTLNSNVSLYSRSSWSRSGEKHDAGPLSVGSGTADGEPRYRNAREAETRGILGG